MMLVRHGFMIVGDPLGGKTSAWKVLGAALTDLGEDKNQDEELPVSHVCWDGRFGFFFCFCIAVCSIFVENEVN